MAFFRSALVDPPANGRLKQAHIARCHKRKREQQQQQDAEERQQESDTAKDCGKGERTEEEESQQEVGVIQIDEENEDLPKRKRRRQAATGRADSCQSNSAVPENHSQRSDKEGGFRDPSVMMPGNTPHSC